MSPERKYLTQEDWRSPHLPEITWQEMLEKQKVFSPQALTKILRNAQEFLETEPGPNLKRRQELAPAWFDYWSTRLFHWYRPHEPYFNPEEPDFLNTWKLRPLEGLAVYISDKTAGRSGALFLAGGEGHAGHVHAAEYMEKHTPLTVWALERDSYFKYKNRPAPFLPIEVRLSMWRYSPISILTVLPEIDENITLSEHYQRCFNQIGAEYSYADELDPNVLEKIRRGKTDIDTIIPHLLTERTTSRIEWLIPNPKDDHEVSAGHEILENNMQLREAFDKTQLLAINEPLFET